MDIKVGKTNGLYTTYHQNGTIPKQGNFVNEKENEKWKFYDENKNLLKIIPKDKKWYLVESSI